MEIEARSASIDTMAVAIQALHVAGRQMTISVFKQLPQLTEQTYDDLPDGAESWGYVMHDIKRIGKHHPWRCWVVYSWKGSLYRHPSHWEFVRESLPQLFIAV